VTEGGLDGLNQKNDLCTHKHIVIQTTFIQLFTMQLKPNPT
jgi:hypothetical protein